MFRSLTTLLLVLGATAPALGQTHFHHVHLNSVDPAAAIELYTTHLSGEKAEFARQMTLGTTFQTVLTDGVELFGAGTRDRDFFMYLDGPDHVTIEVQSAMHHDFMHVHLFSDDPVAAAAWYQQHLGIATRKADGLRSAFIEAPDKMELELVEGHARKP